MFSADRIRDLIVAGIPGATVVVEDPANDGHHFEAAVACPQFVGMPRVRQHQLVYQTLGHHMKSDIHALALKTYTPDAWPHAKS